MMTLRTMALAAAFAAASTVFAAAPAEAQRGAPITQGLTSGDAAALRQQAASMQVEINDLNADNAELNGKVETLEFLLSQSREQVNAMQEDDRRIASLIESLENRLEAQDAKIAGLEAQMRAAAAPASATTTTRGVSGDNDAGGPRVLSSASAPAAPTTISGAPGQTGSLGTLPASALPGEAGPLFASAKSKLLQFDYAGAEAAFRAFLDQFGDDAQAGEAQYWLGEVLYQQEAYAESGAAYTDMIRTYPNDPRAPDALVKLARSMRLVGDAEAACKALDTLPRRYPDASGVTSNLAAVERARSACDT